MSLQLISISFSHYCEKARWGLERAGLAYRERCYPPLLHYRAVARYRTRTVPVLIHPGGVLTDSTDILKWIEQQAPCGLYPSDPDQRAQVDCWEERFDTVLGPATRQHVYAFGFSAPDLMMGPATERVGWLDRLLVPRILPRVRRAFDRLLDLSPAGLEKADAAIDRALDEVAAAVDGRRWLVGEQFSAADLTFASMMAPLILPANYGVRLPSPDSIPPAYAAWIDGKARHPAVAFARRLWAEER
jgi:glutathione S-transferase